MVPGCRAPGCAQPWYRVDVFKLRCFSKGIRALWVCDRRICFACSCQGAQRSVCSAYCWVTSDLPGKNIHYRFGRAQRLVAKAVKLFNKPGVNARGFLLYTINKRSVSASAFSSIRITKPTISPSQVLGERLSLNLFIICSLLRNLCQNTATLSDHQATPKENIALGQGRQTMQKAAQKKAALVAL